MYTHPLHKDYRLFRDPACIAAVLQDEPHTLDGHNVNPEFDAGSGNRRRRKRNLPLDDLGHDGTRGEKRKVQLVS